MEPPSRASENDARLRPREAATSFHAGLTRALRLLAVGGSLEGVLREIVLSLEEHVPGMSGSILVFQPLQGTFQLGAGPSLPREINTRADETPVLAVNAASGARKRALDCCDDITTDSRWEGRRDAFLRYGFRGAWSQPILSTNGSLLGLLAMYFRQARRPDKRDMDLIGESVQLASVAIERKLAEAALRATEDRYRRIVEAANEGVWTFDDSMHTTFVNRRLEEMLGYASSEMVGTPLQKYLRLESQALVEKWFDRCRAGRSERIDVLLEKRDGSEIHTIFSLSPTIGSDGRFQGALAMVIDITDRHRAEEMLVRASRMEATAMLAAGIAHDFNNLMVGVLGGAEVLRTQMHAVPEARKFVDTIAEAGRRAGELAHQLLAFARGGKYWPQPMSLNDVVTEALKLQVAARPAKVRIETKLAADLDAVQADVTQISQVVVSLCLNAFEAIDSDGTIVLETRNVPEGFTLPGIQPPSMAEQPLPRSVLLCVHDTGKGIDREALPHIFEPFFSTKGRGRGLGLAAVFGILQHHGGHVSVESVPGCGTTFYLSLPALPQKARSITPLPPPLVPAGAIEGGTETILVVDDEEMVIDVTQQLLADLGYAVLRADSGERALELMHELRDQVDLVLLDLGMPEMSGAETFERLREIAPKVKVAICSGFEFDSVARSLLDRGCAGFIHKPFELREFAAGIRRALGNKKASS
ncbi:MAG: response regulator [Planctomycetes bacterium]|nr:response regulator [Planctomycetota bacterium]